MHIVNIMFAKQGGGIEQAFVDYCHGLRDRGHKVTAIVFPGSWAQKQLAALSIESVALRNFGEWDIFASHALKKMLTKLAPDIVIAHANRALTLSRRAIANGVPLVGVVQNYSTRRYNAADAVFTTTFDLIATLIGQGIAEENVFHIPNMVHVAELPHRGSRHTPPIIGTMGRFVEKKGFDIYIESLAQLKARNIPFKAVLGGSGPEEKKLRALAAEKGLGSSLEFIGWVADRKQFYSNLDVFCLPSLHEPFGIVLLEAFAHGAPVISTNSEGPKDIITPNYDALIVQKGSASELANAMAKLLADNALAEKLAANAFVKVRSRYALDVVAERIETALSTIIQRKKMSRRAA